MEISGFDADALVTQLMQIERIPLTALENRKTAARTASDAISKIRSQVDAFRLAAAKLAETANFDRHKTAVSNSSIATASVSGTANVGSLTFRVDRLAQAHGLRSIGTVASDSTAVTTASFISVATGTRSIGIDTVRAGAGLAAGTVRVDVTQASAGATTTGSLLAGSTAITAGINDTLDLEVNGVARTVTIAAGTYSAADLTTAVQAALTASGGGVASELDTAGALRLTTTREGSAAGIRITGGNALTDLGLAVQATAATGTDGIIDVGGTITTVTLAEAGQAVAVDTGTGTLDVTLAGGLRVGDTTVTTVSAGSRSLADVAAAISNANGGVSAAAVRVGDGAWRLQLTSRTTGENGRISIDPSIFGSLGGMVESSAAQNASLTIGDGPGAYQVEASTNTFSNILGGVAITARTVSTEAVTVDVTRNDDTIATDVGALVGAANTLLAEIKVQTRFDAVSRTSGTLANNSTVRRLADQIRSALGAQVPGIAGPTGGLASSVGIQVTRDGSFTFDRTKFLDAVTADPSVVARMFARGGTSTGGLTFSAATASTQAGTYDVEITTAATQASTTTLFAGGAPSNTRLGVRIGSTTATIDVTAGQSAAQIISALNDSFATNGVDVVAEADGTGLRIRSDAWGSAGTFEVNTDVLGAGTWDAQTGTDVAGTIAGIAAVGAGRTLSLSPLLDQPAAGLAVQVEGGVTGSVGSFAYQPGISARVVQLATAMSQDDESPLATAKSSADRRVTEFTDQMNRLEDRLLVREANLRRQYSNLQTLLGNLQSQGSWLSSQISSLPTLNR